MAAHLLKLRQLGFIANISKKSLNLQESVVVPVIFGPVKTTNSTQLPLSCFSTSYHHQNEETKVTSDQQRSDKPPSIDNKIVVTTQSDKVTKIIDEFESFREKYIPLTRKSVIRLIMEDKKILTGDERKMFDDLAIALDSAIVQEYHGVLNELKTLFDPINPDKDTISTRQYSKKQRLENEFFLLEKLTDVMEKANYHELSTETLEAALCEHDNSLGIKVSVDNNDYDILRMWALGKEAPKIKIPWYTQLYNMLLSKKVDTGPAYFKRVAVILRLKKDNKLVLKSFKEVPVNSLEMLLPTGKIKMKTGDMTLLCLSTAVGSFSVLAKYVTYAASIQMDSILLVTLTSAFLAAKPLLSYSNRRNRYLADLNRILYFKNVANNRGFLALTVDRAQDESFKEALLVYTCLLSHRPAQVREKDTGYYQMVLTELGADMPLRPGQTNEEAVNEWVENWVYNRSGQRIKFDASEAMTILKNYGLLIQNEHGRLSVLPLEAALKNLPRQPFSVIVRANEVELTEGYDRDEFLETEEEYKKEELKSQKYGWFSRFF